MKQAVIIFLFFASLGVQGVQAARVAWSANPTHPAHGVHVAEADSALGTFLDTDTPDSLATRPPIAVDSIVVTAHSLREIVPAQHLSGEELQRLSTNSVADALRYFSGLQIKDYGGIGGIKTVNVRSLGAMHTGVFLDGLAIGSAQNGVVDMGRFSLDNVEALALYNGQKSDIFQSARDYASASAIYMTSRKPRFETDNSDTTKIKRDNLSLTLKSGSFDLIDGSVLWEHRFGRKQTLHRPYRLASSVNVELMNTSGRYRFRRTLNGGRDTTMTRRNGDVRFIRAEAALFGNIEGGEWRVKGYFYTSDRGYPGSVINEAATIALDHEDRQGDRAAFVQGSIEQRVVRAYSYKLQAKFADDYVDYRTLYTRYRQQEVYFSLANLFTLTRWLSANLSVDGQYNTLQSYGNYATDPRRVTALTAAAAAVRLRKFSATASVLYTYTHEMTSDGARTAPDRHIFTPTAIVSYRPFNRVELDFRAFYKHIFRLPTFADLYYVSVANRGLRPEYSTQYNAGVAYRKEFPRGAVASIEGSVDGYFNQVRDKIVSRPVQGQLIWSMYNIGYVEILGVDVALHPRFRVGRGSRAAFISLRVNYTYQKAQNFSEELKPRPFDPPTVQRGYGDQISYVPWHSGSAVLGLVWRELGFNYSFLYTGKRYLNNNIPANLIPPFHTHDLSISYNFRFPHAALRTTVEVNNLLNRQYEVVAGYPMPGTNFKIILSLTI